MGLVKAFLGSTSGTLADQWEDYFYCDAIKETTIIVKGEKRVSGRSSNTRASNNIISNGSIIAVAEGQCVLITEQGKVVDICAEAGEYIYDSSTEPSIFYGNLGEGIKDAFKTIGRRVTFGGDTGKDQRIYYVNTKELVGNRYGTQSPIPFRVVDTNIGLDIDVSIKCYGEYSYQVTNPVLFYTNVCGNVSDRYLRSDIETQLKAELLTALQPAFAKISEKGIRYSLLPGHTTEIAEALNQILSLKWKDLRGIEIISFGIASIKAGEEDEKMIKELQRNAAFRNPTMAAAQLVGAQSAAMQAAASNDSAGAAMAFMGMGMAGNAGGASAQTLFQMGQQINDEASLIQQKIWVCKCGNMASGRFCNECGSPQPNAQKSWKCACGAINTGMFCSTCGRQRC